MLKQLLLLCFVALMVRSAALATTVQMFPFVGYGADTGLTGGIKHFINDLREPEDRFESLVLVSLRNQIIGDWVLYKPTTLGDFYRAELELMQYPSYFYGVGNSNTPAQRGLYVLSQSKLAYEFGKMRSDRCRWSLFGEALFTPGLSTDSASVFSTVSAQGLNAYTLGFKIAQDQLDRPQNPQQGDFIGSEWRAVQTGGQVYVQANLDYRSYFPIRYIGFAPTENGTEQLGLALRGYTGTQLGTVPFYQYLSLGGAERLRGFAEGRFRDRSFLGLGFELRKDLTLPSEWNVPWPVQAAYFVDAGKVYGSWLGFTFDDMHASQGLGLRILLDPETVVRIDYAFGEDEQALYLAFGQAI